MSEWCDFKKTQLDLAGFEDVGLRDKGGCSRTWKRPRNELFLRDSWRNTALLIPWLNPVKLLLEFWTLEQIDNKLVLFKSLNLWQYFYTSNKKLMEFIHIPPRSPTLHSSHSGFGSVTAESTIQAGICLRVLAKPQGVSESQSEMVWDESSWRIDEYLTDLRHKRPQTQEPWRPGAKKSKTNIIQIPAANPLLPQSPDPWEMY